MKSEEDGVKEKKEKKRNDITYRLEIWDRREFSDSCLALSPELCDMTGSTTSLLNYVT